MRRFAALYAELDASTSTIRKVDALAGYLRTAPAADAAWAVYVLAGGKPRQAVGSRVLREAAREAAGIPEWLFDESYQAVGDLAETVAHLLPPPAERDDAGLADWIERRVLPLRELAPDAAKAALHACWNRLAPRERFVMNKLITGGLRVGVSRQLVIRALARVSGIDEKVLAQRMIGYTDAARRPAARDYLALVGEAGGAQDARERAGQPYPFFLAQPLREPVESLGERARWLAEWKWDGIRAQLVRRAGEHWLWSRGEELITGRFPELAPAAAALPDGVVIDGELLAWDASRDAPMPFATLQRRIGRKTLGPKLLREAPCRMLAYDLLEIDGQDLRERPQGERRALLERLVSAAGHPALGTSEVLDARDWPDLKALREDARARGVEGLMLKRVGAGYGVGRVRSRGEGDWWKWKLDPLSVDAVLVYAQRGHGRRASLYTDYTFAVWDRGVVPARLVPFAKAYSGLSDEEIRRVDATIRRTTREKFGPVRSVEPTMVMELGFEGIARSPRHKSGVAVRFPRILRLRDDKPVDEADSLADLLAMLAPHASGPRS